MRKTILIFFIVLLFISYITIAKPVSHVSLKAGPYFTSSGVLLSGSADFSMNFWVAHVESEFSIGVTASNNTLVITPNASEIFKYVDFNWRSFRVEYGSTGTVSHFFPTIWDVGNPPIGWEITLTATRGKNTLSFSENRGIYVAEYRGLIFSEAFWYKDSSLFVLGPSNANFFLSGGTFSSAYFVGFGGKIGALSMSLLGFSRDMNVFPNLDLQVPSRYVGIFKYDSNGTHAMISVTENEFYLNGFTVFKVLGGNLKIGVLTEFLDKAIPYLKTEINIGYERAFGGNRGFFLNASFGKVNSLWLGMQWGF